MSCEPPSDSRTADIVVKAGCCRRPVLPACARQCSRYRSTSLPPTAACGMCYRGSCWRPAGAPAIGVPHCRLRQGTNSVCYRRPAWPVAKPPVPLLQEHHTGAATGSRLVQELLLVSACAGGCGRYRSTALPLVGRCFRGSAGACYRRTRTPVAAGPCLRSALGTLSRLTEHQYPLSTRTAGAACAEYSLVPLQIGRYRSTLGGRCFRGYYRCLLHEDPNPCTTGTACDQDSLFLSLRLSRHLSVACAAAILGSCYSG